MGNSRTKIPYHKTDNGLLFSAALKSENDRELMHSDISSFAITPIKNSVDLDNAALNAKKFYYSTLPVITQALNKYHNINWDDKLWARAFGYWLYRHVCICFDNYNRIKLFKPNKKEILKDKSFTFLIPENHADYLTLCMDEHSLPIFFHCFFETKKDAININKQKKISYKKLSVKKMPFNTLDTMITLYKNKSNRRRTATDIAFLGMFLSKESFEVVQSNLLNYQIDNITSPSINLGNHVDIESRKKIFENLGYDEFSKFFFNTLTNLLPTCFFEDFKIIFNMSMNDLKERNFKIICCEDWMSNTNHSIYLACCKSFNIKHVSSEHSAGNCFLRHGLHFLDIDNADYFITTGWKGRQSNVLSGGFMLKNPGKTYNSNAKNIIYITCTRFKFWTEFTEENASDHFYLDRVKCIADFKNTLSNTMNKKFLVRTRPHGNLHKLWDTDALLKNYVGKFNTCTGSFTDALDSAGLIIIDHISTALAEILLKDIPFILIQKNEKIPNDPKIKKIFNLMKQNNLLFENGEDAGYFCKSVNNRTLDWWHHPNVTTAREQFKTFFLSDRKNFSNALLTLCHKNNSKLKNRSTLIFDFIILILKILRVFRDRITGTVVRKINFKG